MASRIPAAAPVATRPAPATRWTPPTKGEWSTGLDGKKSDPINLYLHGSLADIKKAMVKAGWVEPMANTTASKLEYAGASVFEKTIGHLWEPSVVKKTVAAMPIAHGLFQGKPDVASFERNNDPLGGRHHFRIYDTGKTDDRGQKVFAVAASLDDGVHFAPKQPAQWFISHSVDPNADKERDELMRTLRQSGGVRASSEFTLPFGGPAPSGLHSADGRVFDVTVR